MEIKEIMSFIKKESERLKQKYGYDDKEKRILARAVKLSEEMGEFSNEILSHISMQREDKEQTNKDKLSEEFADVIITAFLLADILGINFQEAIKNKINKIEKRYK